MESNANEIKALHAATKEALDKMSGDMKAVADKALNDAAKGVQMSAEAKATADKLLTEAQELRARLQDCEQKIAALPGESTPAKPRSAGELFVASDEFKDFMNRGGMKSTQSGCVVTVPRATLTSTPYTGTTTVGVPPDLQSGVIQGTQRRLTVRDLIMPGQTSSNLIQYTKETGFTNNAAPVSETMQKPESNLVYTLMQSPVVTIAHWVKAAKQILDDFPALQSMINGRMMYGLKLVEENQLLKGSGTGNNLNGIYTQATAYAAPITPPGTLTTIDVIRLMLLQAELAEYPSDGIVLHPSDWAAIELTKDSTGGYIFANPQQLATPQLWARRVVATQAMTVDTALVGAFMMGAQIFDREAANVVIATENQDDFIKNMITIRVEERLALAVYRPEAFIKNTNLP